MRGLDGPRGTVRGLPPTSRQPATRRRGGRNMEFGYFTLSDNHYDDNPRTPEPVRRRHHRGGALCRHSSACTRPGSASIISTRSACSPAPTWCSPMSRRSTKHIRLAPAVTVLPLHHPIRVAEQWATLDLLSNGRVDFAAGRGYDSREYLPVPRLVRRQPGHLRGRPRAGAQAVGGRRPHLAPRQALFLRRRAHHAEAGAAADPDLCRLVLASSRSSSRRGSAAG